MNDFLDRAALGWKDSGGWNWNRVNLIVLGSAAGFMVMHLDVVVQLLF